MVADCPSTSFSVMSLSSRLSSAAFLPGIVVPQRSRLRSSSVCSTRTRRGCWAMSVDFSPRNRPGEGSIARALLRLRRPKPVLLSRRELDQQFAVLLMRTAYDVLDELDIIAMDQFQKRFFERRQTEWEHYLEDNANSVRQGVLTDARYFDFISFAQFLTITDAMADAQTAFVEAFNAEGDTRVVRRDPSVMSSPSEILDTFNLMVGERLFSKVLETAGNFLPPLESGSALSFPVLVEGMKEVAVYFYFRGYCLKEPSVTIDKNGQATVLFVGPATLWGTQALAQLRCVPNDYDVLATREFIKAAGWSVEGEPLTKTTESTLSRTYKLRATKQIST